MTFNKPANVTYTEMAMYFDAHIYDDPKVRDDSTLYKYLYLLTYMLACKEKYFHKFEDYDEFSVYVATVVYMRIVKNRLRPKKVVNEDGTVTVEPGKMKSILNYLKSVLYVLKILYQKETSNEIIEFTPNSENYTTFLGSIQNSLGIQGDDEQKQIEIIESISELPDVIKQVINETPYKNDKVMCKRLYTSCLLTLLKSITLSNANKKKLESIDESENVDKYESTMLKLLNKERVDSITLWRLPEDMKDYVQLLINKIKENFKIAIYSIADEYEVSDLDLEDILRTASNTTPNNEMEDD